VKLVQNLAARGSRHYTVHKAQEATVERAFVLVTPAMDGDLAYVAMPRHREAADLYAERDDFTGFEE
jgi:ATP-dependent exoDNAse (exonuclease V) alpha subunit